MSIRTSPWPAGFPCWVDLSVPDVGAAEAFYTSVLGWTFEDQGEEFGNYAIATSKGVAAAGVGPAQGDVPTAWTVYIASDDADATAAAVTANGGTVYAEPFDVGPMGRMLVAADPTGATFGVWQAKGTIGAGIVNEPGALSWEDLRTTDPDAAAAFYGAVFGHTTEPLPDGGEDYSVFTVAGSDAPLGGMGGMEGAPEGTPPHWLAYFGVSDVDAAVASAEAGGGTVITPAFDTPYGRLAAIGDPFGAAFWVIAVDPEQSPDRSG